MNALAPLKHIEHHEIPKDHVLVSGAVEFADEVAGIYFRSFLLPYAGMHAPQHMHTYDHAMIVCSGSARLFVDGAAVKDYFAGEVVLIEAKKNHAFESLEPNTRFTCVHDTKIAEFEAHYVKE